MPRMPPIKVDAQWVMLPWLLLLMIALYPNLFNLPYIMYRIYNHISSAYQSTFLLLHRYWFQMLKQ